MKIAYVAPFSISVPPPVSGGTERVAFHLVEEMVARGHDVTLVCREGSKTSAKQIEAMPDREPTDAKDASALKHEAQAATMNALMAEEFDVIHHHGDVKDLFPMRGRGWSVMATMHSWADTRYLRRLLAILGDEVPFSFVSKRHEETRVPGLRSLGYVHHGIEVDRFSFGNAPGDHLLFLGRIYPTKGVEDAIAIARASGRTLKIAGPIQSKPYFDALDIDGEQIAYVGEADWETKAALYADAAAFLMPVKWEEPFGLVMAEAMACGTPVIGYRRGAVPEIVEDGVSGFVLEPNDVAAAAAAVGRIGEIDRAACRKRVQEAFSIPAMADGYEAMYERFAASSRMRAAATA